MQGRRPTPPSNEACFFSAIAMCFSSTLCLLSASFSAALAVFLEKECLLLLVASFFPADGDLADIPGRAGEQSPCSGSALSVILSQQILGLRERRQNN